MAHLADPGRLRELFVPEAPMYLEPAQNPNRKTQWTAALVQDRQSKAWVSLQAARANSLAEIILRQRLLPPLEAWESFRREVAWQNHRFDFLLEKQSGSRLWLEVKSVTLRNKDLGLFPDAVTDRGRRHLLTLKDLAATSGQEAAVLFLTQREDLHAVAPATHIDPAFAAAMAEAGRAGVNFYAFRCRADPSGIAPLEAIPVHLSSPS